MKKNLFIISGCLLLATTTYAQSSETSTANQIHIGVKAGANYSNIYDTKGQEYSADSKFGFAAGAFVSIPLISFVGIQPEILFSQKGFSATSSVLGSDVSLTRTTNYIDIPLLVALKPTEMITILVGPQYSFLLKQKDVFSNPITDIEVVNDFNTDNIKKNTLCLTGGVDVNVSHLVVGARVGWDLFNNNGDGTSTTPRYKNVWGQLTVGVRL